MAESFNVDEQYLVEVGFNYTGHVSLRRLDDDIRDAVRSTEKLADSMGKADRTTKRSAQSMSGDLKTVLKLVRDITEAQKAQTREETNQANARVRALKVQQQIAELELRSTKSTQAALTKRVKISQEQATARTDSTNAAKVRIAELEADGEELRRAAKQYSADVTAAIETAKDATRRLEAAERERRSVRESANQQDRLQIVQIQSVEQQRKQASRRRTEDVQLTRDVARQRLQDQRDTAAKLAAESRQQVADKRLLTTRLASQARSDSETLRLQRARIQAESRLETVATQQRTTELRARNRIIVGIQTALFNELQQVTRFGFNTIGRIFDTTGSIITKGWAAAMRRFANPTRDAMRETEGIVTSSGERIRTALSRISPAAILGAVAGGAAGKSAFDAFKDYEQLVLGLNRRIGDPERVKKLIADVDKFASATPFEVGPLEALAQSFLTIEPDLDKLVPTLATVADAVAFTGGTGDALDRVRLALAEVKGQGRVQGDEIRQLEENLKGIPVRQLVADQLGISVSELVKRQAAGNLTADEFIPAFLEGLKTVPGLSGIAAASVDTLTGKLGNLRDQFTLNARAVVEQMAPALKAGITILTDFTKRSLTFVKDAAVNIGNLFKLYRFRITEQFHLLASDPVIASAIESVKTGLQAIRDAFNRENSAGQRSAVVKVWEAIPKVFDRIKPAIVAIAPLFERLGDSMQALAGDINERGLAAVGDRLKDIAKTVAPGAGLVTGMLVLRGAFAQLGKGNLVTAGLLGASAGLLTLYRTNETFRGSVDETIGRLRELGSVVGDAFTGEKVSGGDFWDQLAAGLGTFASKGLDAIRSVKEGIKSLGDGGTVSGVTKNIGDALTAGLAALTAPVSDWFGNLFKNLDPAGVLDGIRKLFAPLGRALGEFLGSKEFLAVVGGLVAVAGSAAVGFVQGFIDGLAKSDLAGMIVDLMTRAVAAIPSILGTAFREAFSNGPLVAIAALFAGGLGIAKLVSAVTTGVTAIKAQYRALAAAGTGVGVQMLKVGDKFTALSNKVLTSAANMGSGRTQNALVGLATGLETLGRGTQRAATFVADNFGKIIATFATASYAFSTLFSDASWQDKLQAIIPLATTVAIELQGLARTAETTGKSLATAFAPFGIIIGISALVSWLSSAEDATNKTADAQKRLAEARKFVLTSFSQSLDSGKSLEVARADFVETFTKKVREGDDALTKLTDQTERYGNTVGRTANAITGTGREYDKLISPIKRNRDALSDLTVGFREFQQLALTRGAGPGGVTAPFLRGLIDDLETVKDKVPGAEDALEKLGDAQSALGSNQFSSDWVDALDAVLDITPEVAEQLGIAEETVAQLREQRRAYKDALAQQSLAVDAAQQRFKAEQAVKGEAEKTADAYDRAKQRISEIKDLLLGATKDPNAAFNEAQRALVLAADSAASSLTELLAKGRSVGQLLGDQFSVAGAKFNESLESLKGGVAEALTGAVAIAAGDPARFDELAKQVNDNFVQALVAGGLSPEQANSVARAVVDPLYLTLLNNAGGLSQAVIGKITEIQDYFTANPLQANIDTTKLDFDAADQAITAWLAKPTDFKTIQSFLSIDGAQAVLDQFQRDRSVHNLEVNLQNLAEDKAELDALTADRTVTIGVALSADQKDKQRGVRELKDKQFERFGQQITAPVKRNLGEMQRDATTAVNNVAATMGTLGPKVSTATIGPLSEWKGKVGGIVTSTSDQFKGLPGTVGSAVSGMESRLSGPTSRIKGQFDAITDSINNVIRATGGTPTAPAAPAVRRPTKEIFHSGGVVGEGRTTPVRPLAPGEEMVIAQRGEGVIPVSAMGKMSRAEFRWIKEGRLNDLIASKGKIPGSVTLIRSLSVPEADRTVLGPVVGGLARIVTAAVGFLNTASDLISTRIGSSVGDRPTDGARGPAYAAEWVRAAMALTGVPDRWFAGLMTIARRESNFNPRAINLWDSNAAKGIPSKGIMQTIEPTFRSNMLPGHGDIWNPVDNIAAAIRYILRRYGDISRVQQADPNRAPKGYAYGDIVRTPTLGVFAEAGPEVILPLSRPQRFLELLARSLRFMAGSSGLSIMEILRSSFAASVAPQFANGALFSGRERTPDIGAKLVNLQAERDKRSRVVVDEREIHSHVHVHTNVIDPTSAYEYGSARTEQELRRLLGSMVV